MKLRIPPVFIFFIVAIGMYLLDTFLPFGEFDFFGRGLLIKILGALAIIIMSLGLFQFFRSKTTVDPRDPGKAKVLVTSGIYAYTRNPMYLAMLIVLLAWGLKLGNAFNCVLAALFVSIMNRLQIIPEEEVLLEKFGKAYSQYCSLVRRWF